MRLTIYSSYSNWMWTIFCRIFSVPQNIVMNMSMFCRYTRVRDFFLIYLKKNIEWLWVLQPKGWLHDLMLMVALVAIIETIQHIHSHCLQIYSSIRWWNPIGCVTWALRTALHMDQELWQKGEREMTPTFWSSCEWETLHLDHRRKFICEPKWIYLSRAMLFLLYLVNLGDES